MAIDRYRDGSEPSSSHLLNLNWVDFALGYYDILGRPESKSIASDVIDDEYSQVCSNVPDRVMHSICGLLKSCVLMTRSTDII